VGGESEQSSTEAVTLVPMVTLVPVVLRVFVCVSERLGTRGALCVCVFLCVRVCVTAELGAGVNWLHLRAYTRKHEHTRVPCHPSAHTHEYMCGD